MTHDEIKQQLIRAGRVLVAEGQDDFTRGHISFRLPDNPSQFFMKPHSLGLDEITLENILTIDLEGNVVAGTSRRHSEVYIHSEIDKVRPFSRSGHAERLGWSILSITWVSHSAAGRRRASPSD